MENPVVSVAMAPTLFSDHSQDPAVSSRPLHQAGPGYSVVWSPVISAEPSQLCKGGELHRALDLQCLRGKIDCEFEVS